MKRFVLMATILLTAVLLFGSMTEVKAGKLSTRGVWVSCFEYESYGLKNKPESVFRANVNQMFSKIKASGCNHVYFHVRSYDDAIYPSAVVGWSRYISASGKPLSYNPLQILVSSAHRYGLKFHAWMNPYRVTQKKVLNPAKPETTERIVRQVKEIIDHYNVDGIHFDDYFYPTNEKKYNKISKATKKKHVNAMVQKVYSTVKEKNKKLQFGISPAGDIKYCERIGADVKTWLSKSGYVDYIVPQIYWSDNYKLKGKKTKLFSTRLEEWRAINTIDVPMYVGLALYKTGYSLSNDYGWKKSSKNIAKQLQIIRAGNSEGYVLFASKDLYRPGAAKEIKHYLETIGKIKLNKKKKTIRVGKKYKLRAKAWPSRVQLNVKWRSTNKKIATVSKSGVVKAKRKGKVKIYAYYGTLKKVCKITVKKKR